MKKLLALALVMVLALSLLAACGDSDGNSSDTPGDGDNTPGGGNETPDTNTVAGYLEQFGLTEDDVKADGFTSFEGPDGWLIKVNASAGQFDAWGKKVFDKTKSVSADGKCYTDMYPHDTDEKEWEDGAILFTWCYMYNSSKVTVEITMGDNDTTYRIAIH